MKFRLVGWLASIVASATIVCAIASGAGAANSPAAFNAMFQPPASDGKPIDVAVGLLLNLMLVHPIPALKVLQLGK